MVELRPYPFERLCRRAFRELEVRKTLFDMPLSKAYPGDPKRDLSVRFHGRRASSPLGPAAGPHSQLAQNIVLAWLGGSRIVELKTVQVKDRLEIPRPCIDVRTVGYNVEWSQELLVEESLREYAKASMLIEMLAASGRVDLRPGFSDFVFDMSVGYDLEGIRSDKVRGFIEGMLDASAIVEDLREEIPRSFGPLRDLPFRTRLSDSLTLSTFHGCPPDEIERIIDHLLREHGLHCIVKLNPTLLGADEVRGVLHDRLGYRHIHVPDRAFENDTRWEQAVGFIERLRDTAAARGLGFGVKLTNTLIVEHDGDYLGGEGEKYLSGAPLHVLAMLLVRRIRRRFGASLPISFSAGIDRENFKHAVSLGLVPVTVCTDLLRPGGYARQRPYLEGLAREMEALGASTVDEYILAAGGSEDREQAILDRTERYVATILDDPRYRYEANAKPPKKVGSRLELFDCLTCDKCIPVCPNAANFRLDLRPEEVPVRIARRDRADWTIEARGSVKLEKKHQIANFADFCNECGNCDVFCPEDGGPYVLKPRFFGTAADFRAFRELDGFFADEGGRRLSGRFGGREFEIEADGDDLVYRGLGFSVRFDPVRPEATLRGEAEAEVDLTFAFLMERILRALRSPGSVTFALAPEQGSARRP